MTIDHDFKKFPELTNKQLQEMPFDSPHPQYTEDFWAVVVKVHDADTITLRTDDRDFDFPLRLLDIDAPELSEGGEIARDWLSAKLLNSEVFVHIDKKNRVGKYGRLLGHVVYQGMDVGQEMYYLGLVSLFGRKNEGVIPSFAQILREVAIGS